MHVTFILIALLLAPMRAAAQPSTAAFDRGAANIQLVGTAQFEAWDYNLSREWLEGGAVSAGYFLFDRWSINAEVGLFRARQAPFEAAVITTMAEVLRWHVRPAVRLSPFVEAGAGLAWGTRPVPPRGTRFNFLLQAGGGATWRVSRRGYVLGGLRWFHLSNNGRQGSGRNPDVQAIGAHAGVMVAF